MNEQPIPSPFVKETELDLLRKYFKDNDDLLLAMRAVMLNIDPTEEQKSLVKTTFADEALMKAVEYRFMPRLSKDVPVGQVQDIWLGIDQAIIGQSPETIAQIVDFNETSVEMMKAAVRLLQNPELTPVDVDTWDKHSFAVPLLARNRFIRAIETQLVTLKTLANQPKAEPGEKGKDSSR